MPAVLERILLYGITVIYYNYIRVYVQDMRFGKVQLSFRNKRAQFPGRKNFPG